MVQIIGNSSLDGFEFSAPGLALRGSTALANPLCIFGFRFSGVLMSDTRRSLPTRLLHFGLLLAVLWQLIGSNFVEAPRSNQPGNGFYEVLQIVGLITFGLVLAFWLWATFRRRDTAIGALFPWLSATRMKSVKADIASHWTQLRQKRLPEPATDSPLASAVHGLGLLTALAMGASGAWLYTMNVPTGPLLEIHKLISNLMWAYVVGHAGLAVVHQLSGHRILQRMFGRSAESTK